MLDLLPSKNFGFTYNLYLYCWLLKYAVWYVLVSCFVVRGCVSKRYINVCNCDMFSVVNVHHDHLKFCVVGICVRRYVCWSECNVVSNECDEPITCLVQPIGAVCVKGMCLGSFCFWTEIVILNCDDICMCFMNKQFELMEFVFHSVYTAVWWDYCWVCVLVSCR